MVERPQPHNSPTIRLSDVCLVTVTYGDRAHLCVAAVEEALRQGVGRAIIVSNGATASAFDELAALARCQPHSVELIQLPRNVGSAGGFSTGLRHVIEQTTYPYVWLLDDDNVAVDGALTELLKWRTSLADSYASEDVVVFAARPDTQFMAALLRGVPAARAFPSRGGFAGFNVVEIPRKLIRKLFFRFRTQRPITRPVEVPYGAYGGILLSRSLIRLVGYPDERLILYEDDADYTRRLYEAGAKLFVVPTARLKDIDTSWYMTARGCTPFGRVLSAPSDARVYFTHRNRVYFETSRWKGPRLLYIFNKFVYITTLWLIGQATGRQERVRLVIEAARRGEKRDFEVAEAPGIS